jgi:hypothetical protein
MLAYLRGLSSQRGDVSDSLIVESAVLGGYWDYRDLADGAVSSWASRDTSQQAAVQATGSLQPTKGATGVVFDGTDDVTRAVTLIPRFLTSTTLPDGASASTAGKGWTCTGLARAPDGTFYVGNHGKAQSGDPTFEPSIVHVSADFTTILDEILLLPLYPGIGSVQGVVYDTSDDTLWFANVLESKVCHLTLAGALVGDDITCSFKPNGIAHDPTADKMWIWEEQTDGDGLESRSCVDGTVVNAEVSMALSGSNDMLFYDDANKTLFLSHGDNGAAGNITLYSTATATLQLKASIVLTAEVDAVEGFVIDGNRLYVANDSFFHPGLTDTNIIVTLAIPPPVANIVDLWGVITVPATTGTDAIFGLGDPLSNATLGVMLYSASATDLRLFAHTGGTGTTTQESVIAVSPSLTVPRIVYARADQTNDLLTIWVDGTSVATDSGAALVGSLCGWNLLRIGGLNSAGRSPTMTVKAIGYNMGAGDRQVIEGYLAHSFGLKAQLPSDHPYKTVAP